MIETTISLRDNFSDVVSNMINHTNKLVNSLYHVNNGISSIDKLNIDYTDVNDEVKKTIESTQELVNQHIELNDTINKNADDIEKVENATKDMTNETKKSVDAWDKLSSQIRRAFGVVMMMKGVKSLINVSDAVTMTDARLNMIIETEVEKDALKKKLYKTAQEVRAPLNDFTNEVAKLGILAGDRFGNVDEIVRFQEIASKSFKISGASAAEAEGAMIQLSQALASGVLQGDEFRSVRENAPMIAQAIAKYMGVSIDSLKELSSKGLISADIVKNAVLSMGEEIDEKFSTIPKTWADVWQSIKNTTLNTMTPILEMINKFANSEPFQRLMNNLTRAITVAVNSMVVVLNGLGTVINTIYNYWDYLKYPIGIFIGLLAIGNAQLIATKVNMLATAIAVKVKTVGMWLLTTATTAYTGAQTLANIALNAFPVVAVITFIITLIATIIKLVQHLTKTATVVGTLGGIFFWLGAVVTNVGIGIVNAIVYVINKIFDGINALRNAFNSFLNWVVDGFFGAFNFIGEKVSGTLGFIGNMLKKVGIDIGLEDTFKPIERKGVFNTEHIAFNYDYLEYKDPSEAFRNGVEKAEQLANKLKKSDKEESEDFNDIFNVVPFDELLSNVQDTNKNTGKMASGLKDTTEELKYLRELAEQEHINKFTTAEIKVEMNNTNTLSDSSDVDNIIYQLTQKLEEKLKIVAEGDY